MRKNKLTHLLEPSLRLYFVFLLLFAAVSALFSVAVAVIEAAVVAVLYLYFRRSNAQRQKEIIKYIESVTCNMDTATKDTMVNAPLPMVIFRPENDEVIWSERPLSPAHWRAGAPVRHQNHRGGARLLLPLAHGGQD